MTQPASDAPSGTPHEASYRLPQLRWSRWFIFWALILVALAALLSVNARLDSYLWCATRWVSGDHVSEDAIYIWAAYREAHRAEASPSFYMITPPPMDSQFWHRTESFWSLCKYGGEPLWIVPIVLILITLFCRRQPLLAWSAGWGMAFAGFLGWLIRSIDGRFRPTHLDGANQWEFLRGFAWEVKNLSFPSGHATLAFAAAGALAYAFPRFRLLLIILASFTAISRVVQQAHFWSDVLMGAALGWSVTWFTLYYGDWWFQKHNTLARLRVLLGKAR
jgi:membrane-associated phospholipid phosphatase